MIKVITIPKKDEIPTIFLSSLITDYATFCGNYLNIEKGRYLVCDSKNMCLGIINEKGDYFEKVNSNNTGIRPVLEIYESLDSFYVIRENERYMLAEYGEYPQYVVNEEQSDILEKLYNSDRLMKTFKKYQTNYYEDSFFLDEGTSYDEYFYDGGKYIRAFKSFDNHSNKNLSSSNILKKIVWIKVSPIRWIVDKKMNKMYSEKILLSTYDIFNGYDSTIYCNSDGFDILYSYLNDVFAKNIVPSDVKHLSKEEYEEYYEDKCEDEYEEYYDDEYDYSFIFHCNSTAGIYEGSYEDSDIDKVKKIKLFADSFMK